MKDLLKEAIADAKAVKETALANAKIALEEAFAPRLQSMLSAKLAEEMAEDEPAEGQPEATATDDTSDTTPAPAAGTAAPEDDTTPEGDGETNEGDEYGTETGEAGSEAPVEAGDDDLDLDEIIRELEMDSASSEEAPVEEPAVDASAKGTETANEGDALGTETGEAGAEAPVEGDEDVNIDEIIKSLREDDESAEETAEDEPKKEDLEEAYNVIRFLKGKINEVNMLNAKLLYSNKLFRNFSLNDKQKMTVIENFDRAHNLREVKLVYTTLAEGFKMPASKRTIKESFASKPVASTKPAAMVLSEGADLANRFKKLAGLIK